MKRILLLLLLALPLFVPAQKQFDVDSLTFQLESASQDSIKIKTYLELSNLYRNADFKKSLEYANSALELAEEAKVDHLYAKCLNTMGAVLFGIGLYDQALEHYLKCKSLLEETPGNHSLMEVNHNIGAIYFRLADQDRALMYFKEALASANEQIASGDCNRIKEMAVLYNSIGNIYDTKGEDETAITYYEKALEGSQKCQDHANLGVIYNNLGKIHLDMGKKEEALRYLNLSYEHRKKVNDKYGLARSHSFLSLYYLTTGDLPLALEHANQALKEAEEIGALYTIRNISRQISQIHRLMGNADEAINALLTYNQYTDSIFNQESVKAITRMQMEYDYKKVEKERRARQQRMKMIYFSIFAVLILGFVIFGLLYGFVKERVRRIAIENQHLEKDLDVRNKELTTNVMYLLKNTEVMSSASEKLQDLKDRLKGDNKDTLQQVIHELQAAVEKDAWEEFEIRFQQVHTNFLKDLREKFPDLTPGELKICAFLRLNMTTKEISSITHQSIKSIEVTRSRIRKKLNLTNTETNLNSYLTSF